MTSTENPRSRSGKVKRWLKIVVLGLAGLLVLAVVGSAALFLRPDLSREQLGEYVSVDSRFLELPSGATVHYRDQGARQEVDA